MHPSAFLYYAGAFALVAVGAALAYALIRLGNALGGLNRVISDVEKELPETLKNARETLSLAKTTADNAVRASAALADSASEVRDVVGKVAGTVTFINDRLISKIAIIVNVVGFLTDLFINFFGDKIMPKPSAVENPGYDDETKSDE